MFGILHTAVINKSFYLNSNEIGSVGYIGYRYGCILGYALNPILTPISTLKLALIRYSNVRNIYAELAIKVNCVQFTLSVFVAIKTSMSSIVRQNSDLVYT